MLRFRVRTLLLVVAIVAISVVVFINMPRVFASIIGFVGFSALLYFLIVATVGTGHIRAYAIGFALGVLVYSLFHFLGLNNMDTIFDLFIVEIHDKVSAWQTVSTPGRQDAVVLEPDVETVYSIFHQLVSLVIGHIAGIAAIHIYRRHHESV